MPIADFLIFMLASLVVLIGAALQTISGIGMAVVAAPILVLIDPAYLPAPILALGCVLSGCNAARFYRLTDLNLIGVALVARVIGSFLGVLIIAWIAPATLAVIFAGLIISSVVISVYKVSIDYTTNNLIIGGFLSGVMGTATSIGGPPIAMVMQNCPVATARAQLSVFFLFSTFFSLLLLTIFGHFSYHQLQLTLWLLPALIAGFIIASYVGNAFKQHHFKHVIHLMSVISSIIILLKAWVNA